MKSIIENKLMVVFNIVIFKIFRLTISIKKLLNTILYKKYQTEDRKIVVTHAEKIVKERKEKKEEDTKKK
jgi:hypothetical protein